MLRRRGAGQPDPSLAPFRLRVLGRELSCVAVGNGPPVVFLQLGIASSHMWRRIVPSIASASLCIAVDLVGTGASARLLPSGPETYRLTTHRTYLEACFEIFALQEPIVLVVHGLGSMVGFDWASRHPDAVRAIVHMESIVRPTTWADFENPFRSILRRVRRPGAEVYALESDEYFHDAIRREVTTPLSAEIVAKYAEEAAGNKYNRQALLTALREIPISGQPAQARSIVGGYAEWLTRSEVPKLLIRGKPGYILSGRLGRSAERLPRQQVVDVIGSHLLPEDAPDGVGRFIRSFIDRL